MFGILHLAIHPTNGGCGKISLSASLANLCRNLFKDEMLASPMAVNRDWLFRLRKCRIAVFAEIFFHSYSPNWYTVIIRKNPEGRNRQTTSTSRFWSQALPRTTNRIPRGSSVSSELTAPFRIAYRTSDSSRSSSSISSRAWMVNSYRRSRIVRRIFASPIVNTFYRYLKTLPRRENYNTLCGFINSIFGERQNRWCSVLPQVELILEMR